MTIVNWRESELKKYKNVYKLHIYITFVQLQRIQINNIIYI